MTKRLKMVFSLCTLLLFAYAASGCELSALPRATPTVLITQTTPTLTETPATSPTQPPTATVTLPPRLATSTLTPTSDVPTITLTPSATPGPMAYTIQVGDTYYYLMQRPPFNYDYPQATGLIPQFLQINPTIRSIDQLPSPGSTIYIPLPPPTPTPVGYEATLTAQPPQPNAIPVEQMPTTVCLIAENDTILKCAEEFDTNLPVLATLNPQIDFISCNFALVSGGPDCSVPLRVGDQVFVPAPTPTPTLSPTPSGNETATPTPTHDAPALVFPPEGGAASARTFQLQWVSVGELQPNEAYFVEVQDLTAGTQIQDATRSTYYMLPESMVPTDGQTHTIQWRVSVAASGSDSTYIIVGALEDWRTFLWQSR